MATADTPPAQSVPSKVGSDNDFSLLNYFEIQGVSNSHYLSAPAHGRAQQFLPGTRLFIRRVTWGQPAQGGLMLSRIRHLQRETGSHLPWLLQSSWERPHGPLVPTSPGSSLPASHPCPGVPHKCPQCKSSRKPPGPGNPRQHDTAHPAPRTRSLGCASSTSAEGSLKSDPNHRDGAFCILGILCIPWLSMEAAQAPTLSCKCGRRGQGLQGECCSCSTMRAVSGMKSAGHYKFSGPGGIADFRTQKPCPGDAPAGASRPPTALRQRHVKHRRAETATRALLPR